METVAGRNTEEGSYEEIGGPHEHRKKGAASKRNRNPQEQAERDMRSRLYYRQVRRSGGERVRAHRRGRERQVVSGSPGLEKISLFGLRRLWIVP